NAEAYPARRRWSLQQPSVKGQRQQCLEAVASFFLGQVRQQDLEVAAELPENLPARATWRRRRLGVGDDGDAGEDAVPFRERLEHRDPLGANRQAVSRVLDVAAREDGAVGALERRADFEMRECRGGVL